MNGFPDIQEIMLGVLLLLPGFIWISVEEKLIPRSRMPWSERVITFLAYSAISYGIWFVSGLEPVAERIEAREHSSGDLLVAVLALLGTPFLGGFVTGLVRKFNVAGKVLGQIGLQTVHRIDTGWDWMFLKAAARPCMMKITTIEGDLIWGYFGSQSMASLDPTDKDIFLERAHYDKDGELRIDDQCLGVWVRFDTIKRVHIYKGRLENNDPAAKRGRSRRKQGRSANTATEGSA